MTADQPTPDEDQVAAELGAAPEPGAPVFELGEATGGAGGGDQDKGRFGVYDTQRLRFLGGVHATRKDARKAAKGLGVTDPQIRPL